MAKPQAEQHQGSLLQSRRRAGAASRAGHRFSLLAFCTVLSAALSLLPGVREAGAAGCPTVQNSPFFTIAYGSVLINSAPAAAGTVVEARSPAGTTVGCFTVASSGSYGAMYIYGADGSVTPPVPGMHAGEAVSFFVNGSAATPAPALVWANDRDLHQVNLAITVGPSISVSPAIVPIGSSISVRGDRFTAGQTVELRLDAASGPMLGSALVDADGSFTKSVSIPTGTGLGQHTVNAVISGILQAEKGFTLTMLLDLLPVLPASSKVRVGESVNVAVKVHSGPQLLHGVEAYLRFDPMALEVEDTDASTDGLQSIRGDCFPDVLLNAADNQAGTVSVSFGVNQAAPQPASGDCTLATIRFKGKAERLDGTAVSFTLPPAFPGTRASFQGQTIPLSAASGILQVVGKHLVFTSQPVKGAHSFALGIGPVVRLQDGLGNLWPDSSTPVTLRIKAGTGAPGAMLSCSGGLTRTTALGLAGFAGCSIDLKGQGYRLEAMAPEVPTAVTGSFEVIWAGDANGDCLVDILDFSVIVRSFSKRLGDPGYDPRADLNGDNLVDIVDFSVFVTLFGTRCPDLTVAPISGAAGTVVTVTGSAYVANREVTITLDGAVVATTPATVVTDDRGSFAASFTIPGGVTPGGHVIKASQASGRVVAGAVFTVP